MAGHVIRRVKDSDGPLSGLVKMRKTVLLLGKIELTKNCTATIGHGFQ
jgi:hypothetical protein